MSPRKHLLRMDLVHACVFSPFWRTCFRFLVNYSTTWYNFKAQNKCVFPFSGIFSFLQFRRSPSSPVAMIKVEQPKWPQVWWDQPQVTWTIWKGENYAIIVTLHRSSSNAILHGCCFKDFIQTKLVTHVLSLNSCDFFDSSDNNTHLTRSNHTRPTTPIFFLWHRWCVEQWLHWVTWSQTRWTNKTRSMNNRILRILQVSSHQPGLWDRLISSHQLCQHINFWTNHAHVADRQTKGVEQHKCFQTIP